MHSAPAVNYPVGRSTFPVSLIVLVFLSGSVTGLLWILQGGPTMWMQGFFVFTLLGTCLFAFFAWWRTPVGALSWNGQIWTWTTADTSANGIVTVHLDLQFFLLLCLRTDAGMGVWLVPEVRGQEVLWRALRRAVFSRGSVSALQQSRDDVRLVPLEKS